MIEEVDHRVKGMMQRLPSKVTDGQKPPQEKNPRKTPWRNEPPQYATTSIERSVWI
jgi:hypothetical protein